MMEVPVRGGFGKADLSGALPESRPIDEAIEARAAFFNDGTSAALWCVLDFMDFDFSAINRITAAVSAAIAVPEKFVHILTTHNHGAGALPDLNVEAIAQAAVQAAVQAAESAEPLFMRFAAGETPGQWNCRRRIAMPEFGENAMTSIFFGADAADGYAAGKLCAHQLETLKNSGSAVYCGSTEQIPPAMEERRFAPGDPLIAVWCFENLCGEIKGWFCRYAAHAVCCNRSDHYSSDYPFYVRETLEAHGGGTALFFNGPCGDIAPGMKHKREGIEKILGKALALRALELLQGAERQLLTVFSDQESRLPVVCRPEIRQELTVEKKIDADIPTLRRKAELMKLAGNRNFLLSKAGDPDSPGDIRLGLLQLNNTLLLAFPGETFWTTARKVLDNADIPAGLQVVTVTEHDRTVMYIVPEEETASGGYENTCRLVSDDFEAQLVSDAIKLLSR